jgi:hypothetical protein
MKLPIMQFMAPPSEDVFPALALGAGIKSQMTRHFQAKVALKLNQQRSQQSSSSRVLGQSVFFRIVEETREDGSKVEKLVD